ncbi:MULTISPECIES: ABC transporter ATP-binding protein [unclassified Halanaerobium]|uniref:ABC transporter ATP-binding protein n=1 Tax=unclassified Halanaerobium TaxID=2641197 RepID=UPI000DF2B9DA|nr:MULTISPECIES: ATP-binding cassette domain-containing protein [unclassified Halanaerobium]RCW50652.1 tungstate transport system ATP-binding protein [Halanaerobium sp. MA284_MarDTE_T2]RCW86820.1 tungstate transport system ATP-binding protein [Halanaerobium sp. DL-01]
MSSDKIILKALNIKKNIKGKNILNLREFNVYEGQFNFIIGHNGSGKTTLLNILSLVDDDFSGDLIYKNQTIGPKTDKVKLRRRFSVIWQNPYFYRGSVIYNISLPLRLRGLNKNQYLKKTEEIAKRLEIENLLEQSAATLSGGEKQKVSIARALITEPEIVFVDEPTTNLDEESIEFFNSHFAELVTEEMTVVMVTHDKNQIRSLAEKITVLKKGSVQYSGPIKGLHYQNDNNYYSSKQDYRLLMKN